MQFEEYNGWPNFLTWDVFTVMTSHYQERLQGTCPSKLGNLGSKRLYGVEGYKTSRYYKCSFYPGVEQLYSFFCAQTNSILC